MTRLAIGLMVAIWTICIGLPQSAGAAEKLTAEQVGPLGQPEGKIAFIREGNIAVMNADGSNQFTVSEVSNADGRLSWAPDGKRVLFTRKGSVDAQEPDFQGGHHKLYDLFVSYLDSAMTGNSMFWRRITTDNGSRDPEWSADGSRVIFWKDMNANLINAGVPSYQICTMAPDGSGFQQLRNDGDYMDIRFVVSPTMNADGDIVAVYFDELKPVGMILLPKGKHGMSIDSLKAPAEKNISCVAPSWSPDGKWVAYINASMQDAGLYVATPDLKTKYLVTKPPVGTYLYSYAPSWSPNSKWLTYSTTDGSIWICDMTGGNQRRLSGPGVDKAPAWSKAPPK